MKILIYIGLFFGAAFTQQAIGSDEDAYVDGDKPFLEIKDVNRQAEAWGTCSATYNVMSMLLTESNSAQAKEYSNLGSGAAVAVVMTHVADGLSADMNPDRFNSLWSYSQILGDSIPETSKTMILAEAETLGESDAGSFITKLAETVKICMANLESQQLYIDTWRELAKSGLLTMPNK